MDNIADMEVIHIDMTAASKDGDFSSFLEKIEVLPLETNDSVLLRGFDTFTYCEEQDIYIVMDMNMIVYLFSKDGKFISSSSKAYGQGPGQYVTISNVCSNPYTQTIDLLDPYGVIYCYDLNFNFKHRKKIDRTPTTYASFSPVSANTYLLAPLLYHDNGIVHVVDYEQEKITGVMEYGQNLSFTHMMRNPILQVGDELFFSPCCLNYHFYQMDIENAILTPVVKLDFGKKMIDEGMLVDKFGKFTFSKNTGEQNFENGTKMMKRHEYLEESDYPLPVIRLLNEKYIYVQIVENRKPSNFIYNRETKEGFLQHKDSPFKLPYIIEMKDNNVLYTLIAPFQIKKHIHPQFMSEETLQMINDLKEDDNPVVMKYYLK
jgi:hypothetical protein